MVYEEFGVEGVQDHSLENLPDSLLQSEDSSRRVEDNEMEGMRRKSTYELLHENLFFTEFKLVRCVCTIIYTHVFFMRIYHLREKMISRFLLCTLTEDFDHQEDEFEDVALEEYGDELY